jgi:hypothetical protein
MMLLAFPLMALSFVAIGLLLGLGLIPGYILYIQTACVKSKRAHMDSQMSFSPYPEEVAYNFMGVSDKVTAV